MWLTRRLKYRCLQTYNYSRSYYYTQQLIIARYIHPSLVPRSRSAFLTFACAAETKVEPGDGATYTLAIKPPDVLHAILSWYTWMCYVVVYSVAHMYVPRHS